MDRDSGLVDARFKQASLAIVSDLKDPFCVAELSAERLKDDPASLFDEAAAQSLTGGRRIVRIKEVTDSHHKPLESFLPFPRRRGIDFAFSGGFRAAFALTSFDRTTR